jgi:two-component sensor histidine kinase/tetratricopeptide (TPR) repeat protein
MFIRFFLLAALIIFTSISIKAQSVTELKAIRAKLAQNRPDSDRVNQLLALGGYYIHKPGELANDMDSSLLLIKQARQLGLKLNYNTGVGKSMLLEAETYREKGDRAKAWKLTENAFTYFTKYHLNHEMGESYLAFAAFFNNDDDQVEKKIGYTEKALPYLATAGDLEQKATAMKYLGDYYQIKGDYEKAIKTLEESLAIYQRIRYAEIQGVCDLLGFTYQRHGNTVLALKYGLLAVKTAETLQDSSLQLCTIYNRLALTYYIMRKNNLAYTYYQKALKIAQRYKDDGSIQQIQFNLIILLRRQNKPGKSLAALIDIVKKYPPKDLELTISSTFLFANLYMDLQKYPQAKPYINSLLEIRKAHCKDPVYTNFLNQPVIRYYYVTRQFANAYPYLMVNDSLLQLHHVLKSIVDNQLSWSKIDSALGNNLSALKHYQAYKAGSDSLKEDNLNKQLKELQFQFDVDNKDRDIVFLTQQGQLQQNQIRGAAIIRNVIVGGLVILVMFSGLIYSRYIIKKRGNELLTIKQEEINHQNQLLKKVLGEKEWLLKEIHHRVKNNLQIVISLLNTQSAYLENEDALFAIRNSQHRMHAISLIHQKLYQSENLAAIDMSVYIHELADYLQESFDTDRRVTYLLDIEPLIIDVAQAVPLGLIMNESISNAMKYAFAPGQKGRIIISLKPRKNQYYELNIADNGKGLPHDFDFEQSSSLGMSLMQGLAIQLEGDLKLSTNNGLNVCVIFKPASITKNEMLP